MKSRLMLASASPRRRRILKEMGLTFEVIIPDVEEVHWDDDPTGTVRENAKRKCRWAHERNPGTTIIAADTIVVFEEKCIGKPESMIDAKAMLQKFAGKTQIVYTGVAMVYPQREMEVFVDKSTVRFRDISDNDIEEYHKLVNPLDKAGAYGIGQHRELIISGYDGSLTNIMGLPKEMVEKLLCK